MAAGNSDLRHVLNADRYEVAMNIRTHQEINGGLCGKPLELKDGYSRVELHATAEMAVDASGLVHGGFVFGLADHAAMVAVNHPNVVLGGADVRFLKPVKVHDLILAEAALERTEGKKHLVRVTCSRENEKIFEGVFTCFVLEKHVLG
jgi:acyl-coenzyme A thioesterase PaaI-like protein